MTAKQKLFAEEYVRDRDGGRAYMVAYPTVKNKNTASNNASRLLGDARFKEVQDYVKKLVERATDEAVADVHEVLVYWTKVMRGQTVTEMYIDGVPFEKHPDGRERLKASEMLAKYHQMFVQRQEVEVNGGGLIVLTEATDGEP